ncbi:hypothetical protein B0A55_06056 [Friedmanniomyces simplex]|uniref:Nap family protein n=1 Tax=Friedmanniomyces simplex TaxID=329884 RepID=A0A4U0XCK3_9PEZI|nr:hypothetical protein B0A55_06056 [Friedmanniomyces simplex]
MATEAAPISYEDLAAIEAEFQEIDTEMMRKQHAASRTAYARRAEAVARIPNFWPLVLEQAPPEIDQHIHSHDSRVISEHLTGVSVTRVELEEEEEGGATAGDPRSLRIRLEFSPNDVFSDEALEKTFWYRRARDGWTGLVSEPVRIHWRKGKDATEGLTDGAVALFEAREKAGDMRAKGLAEYAALGKKVEHWNGANTSFFTWFGYVSGRRYISAEESEAATAEYRRRRDARKHGEQVDVETAGGSEDQDDEEAEDDQAVEVHEAGEELAVAFAEDLWPDAIKLFTQAQEMGEMSDPEFEEDDGEEDDDGSEEEVVDIRSLVQSTGKAKSRDSSGPPAAKRAKR